MTIVRRSSPLGELVSLRQAMDRLFEDSFVRPSPWPAATEGLAFPLDARMTGEELVVQASLPGVKAEDLSVTVENGTLRISGETRSEVRDETAAYLLNEIRRGSFSRMVSLPDAVEPERATATFEDGLLTLHIPRAERVKPRAIRITPTTNGHATGDQPSSGSDPASGTPEASGATGAAGASA